MSTTLHIIAGLEPKKLRLRTVATMQAVNDGIDAVRIFDERTRPVDADHRIAREVMAVFLTERIERLEALREELMNL